MLGLLIFATLITWAIVNRALKLMREDETRLINQQHVQEGYRRIHE